MQFTQSVQQSFRVRPRNVSAVEGDQVELHCEVANLAGQVQWSKDGFLLGKYFFFNIIFHGLTLN